MKISKSTRNTEFDIDYNGESYSVFVVRNYKKKIVVSYLFRKGERGNKEEVFDFDLSDEEVARCTVKRKCDRVKKAVEEFNERNGNETV